MKSDGRQTPTGTKTLCVFDTNAYRELTVGKSLAESKEMALKLRGHEMAAGILSAANPFVIWELIGHLDSQADPAYEHCLNALIALSEHAWSRSDPSSGVCLVADAQSTVCDALFGKVPSAARTNVEALGGVAAHVRQSAPDLTNPAAANNIRVFAQEMRKKEAAWLADLQKTLEGCDPKLAQSWVGGATDKQTRRRLRDFFGSARFQEAWAKIGVIIHAVLVGVTLTPQELAEKSDMMRHVFAAPFHFTRALLQKFPTARDLNLASNKRRWGNYVWDCAICYTIGPYHQLDDAAVLLVTSDRAILKAAAMAGCQTSVKQLSDYIRALGV